MFKKLCKLDVINLSKQKINIQKRNCIKIGSTNNVDPIQTSVKTLKIESCLIIHRQYPKRLGSQVSPLLELHHRR